MHGIRLSYHAAPADVSNLGYTQELYRIIASLPFLYSRKLLVAAWREDANPFGGTYRCKGVNFSPYLEIKKFLLSILSKTTIYAFIHIFAKSTYFASLNLKYKFRPYTLTITAALILLPSREADTLHSFTVVNNIYLKMQRNTVKTANFDSSLVSNRLLHSN